MQKIADHVATDDSTKTCGFAFKLPLATESAAVTSFERGLQPRLRCKTARVLGNLLG
jgi:hypothetical protein